MIKITFPDGSVKEYAEGTTAYQIAESISPRLAADSLAASVNGATVDMTRPIEADASVKFYKWDDEEGKHAFWHTSSHLLAEALEALYPGIKFGIGPAIQIVFNLFHFNVRTIRHESVLDTVRRLSGKTAAVAAEPAE